MIPALWDDPELPPVRKGRVLTGKERDAAVLDHLLWLDGPRYEADFNEAPIAPFMARYVSAKKGRRRCLRKGSRF